MKLFVGQLGSHHVALAVMISRFVGEDPNREFFPQECSHRDWALRASFPPAVFFLQVGRGTVYHLNTRLSTQ